MSRLVLLRLLTESGTEQGEMYVNPDRVASVKSDGDSACYVDGVRVAGSIREVACKLNEALAESLGDLDTELRKPTRPLGMTLAEWMNEKR